MKKRMLTYTWVKNGAWIDKNWRKLKALCTEEAVDAELTEVPFVRAKLQTVRDEDVLFQIQSNSQYVFMYMMQAEIETAVKTMVKNKK